MVKNWKSILGIGLLLIAFSGTLFFRRYHGSLILHPFLFYIAFISVGLIGLWLLFSDSSQELTKIEQNVFSEKREFKHKAEKVAINIDYCEFRNGSYAHEVADKTTAIAKALTPIALHNVEIKKAETILQSYLIYSNPGLQDGRKYISPAFPVDAKTLEYYVLISKLSLYIDRFDRNKYLFDADN